MPDFQMWNFTEVVRRDLLLTGTQGTLLHLWILENRVMLVPHTYLDAPSTMASHLLLASTAAMASQSGTMLFTGLLASVSLL